MKALLIAALCLGGAAFFFFRPFGSPAEAGYKSISQQEAYDLMKSRPDAAIVDARTEGEYRSGRIPGAILLPYDEVPQKAPFLLPDKSRMILVYCRSGNRSKKASAALAEMGYTQVLEFGGIITWPYETER